MSITLTDAECAEIGLRNEPDNVLKQSIERVIQARVDEALAPIRDLAGERGNDEALDEALGELDAVPRDDDIPNCERWTALWLPVTADGRPPRYRVRRGDVEQSVPVGHSIHNAADAVEHVTGGRVIYVDPAAESDADPIAGWHPKWAVVVQLPA